MVTEIRQLDPISMLWNSYATVLPGEQKTITQNLPDGEKVLYVVECDEKNRFTTINKAPYDPVVLGNEDEWMGERSNLSFVRELKRGEEYFLTIRHNGSKVGRFMKFTHK